MRFLILFQFLVYSVSYNAQRGLNPECGTRSLALAGIYTTLDGADALFSNFSNLGSETSFMALGSTSRRFELTELTTASLGFSFPLKNVGYMGLSFSSYGFETYSEQKLSLLYARKIFDLLSLSLNLDYNLLRINSHGHTSALSFGLGLTGQLSGSIYYGINIFNPERIEIANNTEMATAIRCGFKFILSGQLTAFTELKKVIDEDPNMIFAMEYLAGDKIFLRLGTHTNPGGISFGIGYQLSDRLSLDSGVSYNTLLGLTPGFCLKYSAL
ncbi:MAG: hypothetical protein KJO50_11660 [Bacteroidia bacterium]|nr:hypothetical protein [Bacteroidia bacterium]